jgi:hypothetical protein
MKQIDVIYRKNSHLDGILDRIRKKKYSLQEITAPSENQAFSGNDLERIVSSIEMATKGFRGILHDTTSLTALPENLREQLKELKDSEGPVIGFSDVDGIYGRSQKLYRKLYRYMGGDARSKGMNKIAVVLAMQWLDHSGNPIAHHEGCIADHGIRGENGVIEGEDLDENNLRYIFEMMSEEFAKSGVKALPYIGSIRKIPFKKRPDQDMFEGYFRLSSVNAIRTFKHEEKTYQRGFCFDDSKVLAHGRPHFRYGLQDRAEGLLLDRHAIPSAIMRQRDWGGVRANVIYVKHRGRSVSVHSGRVDYGHHLDDAEDLLEFSYDKFIANYIVEKFNRKLKTRNRLKDWLLGPRR